MRLIDADEFKRINKRLLHCDFPYLSELTLEELLDEMPTVDAAPVKHGHWIQTQAKDESGNAYYSCSVCGSGECHVPTVDVPFCWKCGSRMDEVTE